MNKKFEKERKIYYLKLFHFYDVHKYGGGGIIFKLQCKMYSSLYSCDQKGVIEIL